MFETFEEFRAAYLPALKNFLSRSRISVYIREDMEILSAVADLHDAHPEWAARVEDEDIAAMKGGR